MGFERVPLYVSIKVNTSGKNIIISCKYCVSSNPGHFNAYNSELKVDWIISLNKLVGAL